MSRLPARTLAIGVLLGMALACAGRGAFRLVEPPAVRDEAFPGGYRLLTKAPLDSWLTAQRFATRAACERARVTATDAAIERAHAEVGDEAKNDLGVRRAVNARCVRNAP